MKKAPYFIDCISEHDLDEVNIEIMRNTLYKVFNLKLNKLLFWKIFNLFALFLKKITGLFGRFL